MQHVPPGLSVSGGEASEPPLHGAVHVVLNGAVEGFAGEELEDAGEGRETSCQLLKIVSPIGVLGVFFWLSVGSLGTLLGVFAVHVLCL